LTRPQAAAGESLRVLLVEDNVSEAKLLVSLLSETARGRSLAVDTVHTLGDARRAAATGSYDLVVLDLGLPDADADAVVDTVPELAFGRALVVLTGREDDAAAAAALASGAEDYLVKGSFEPDMLGRCFVYAVERARRRERDRELLARMAQLEHMATLGTTAGAIAHEVNNPLAYALLALEHATGIVRPLSERRENEPLVEALEQLEVATEGIERVAGIVRDMLTYVRPHDAPLARTTIQDDVRWALDVARKKLDPAIAVRIELRSTQAVEIRRGVLGRVVLNLLLNTRHAFPPPIAHEARVQISSRDEAGEIVLAVVDNGRGMEPAHQRRAFEPFFTLAAERGSTGLGLFVVRNLVEDFGGTVTLEGVPGEGTRVTVRLPAAV
jgi:signal transduction histidine kinase